MKHRPTPAGAKSVGRRQLLQWAVAGAISPCAWMGTPQVSFADPLPAVPWPVDHHMHLRSRQVYEATAAMCSIFGKQACQLPDPEHAVIGATQALAALDAAHVRKGVVLSTGYLFGSPYLESQHYEVAKLVREENEYVAEQVAQAPGRLIGFFSVDPLHASAADEIRFWAGNRRLTGLKLHLTAAGITFKDTMQVRQLADVIALASDQHLPILIHLRSTPDFGSQQTEAFIRDVLPRARSTTVQIAHAGGWSGTDQATFDILQAFAAHIAANDPVTQRLLFDLSGVIDTRTTSNEAAKLAALMGQIGLTRFLVASDFDFSTPLATDQIMRSKLPLSAARWQLVAGNRAPWAAQ